MNELQLSIAAKYAEERSVHIEWSPFGDLNFESTKNPDVGLVYAMYLKKSSLHLVKVRSFNQGDRSIPQNIASFDCLLRAIDSLSRRAFILSYFPKNTYLQ